MKPTRNIVKPNNGLWKTKSSVWYQKNDDSLKKAYIKDSKKFIVSGFKGSKPTDIVHEGFENRVFKVFDTEEEADKFIQEDK